MFQKLLKYGVSGNLLHVLQSMYFKLKSCVKLNGKLSDFFNCNVGLMQGESLSPFLYAIYVNDMEIELIIHGIQSYELRMLNLYLFMYADDTVLFSENVHDLQKMIDTVNECSVEKGLHINLSKTKIVVFRSKGIVKQNEKWYLNGNFIDICDEFMYLGLLFNYNGSFTNTQKVLTDQGRKAVFYLYSQNT